MSDTATEVVSGIRKMASLLRDQGVEPKEVRVTSATYRKLRAAFPARNKFDTIDGIRIVIDDRAAGYTAWREREE